MKSPNKSNTLKKILLSDFVLKIKSFKKSDKERTINTLLTTLNIDFPLILAGKETIRLKRVISALKLEEFKNKDIFLTYFGPQLNSASSINPVLSLLSTESLFSKTKIISIIDADKLKANYVSSLIKAIKRKTPDSHLILTTSSFKKPSSTFKKLLEVSKSLIEVPELKGASLFLWIEKEAKLNSTKITKEAAHFLSSLYEGELELLSSEIEKMSLIVKKEEPITLNLVKKICQKEAERTSFELVNLIAQKKLIESNILINNLIEQGFHPLQITGMLNKSFRTLLAKKTPSKIPLHPDINNAWFFKNISTSNRFLSESELKNLINLTTDLDLNLKGSKLPPQILLKNFIQQAIP